MSIRSVPTTAPRRRGRSGFTLIELVVVMAAAALAVAVVVTVTSRVRSVARSVSCVSHLRQIYSGLVQYCSANDRTFPDPYGAGVSWEQLIAPYVPDSATFECPDDGELFPTIGSSYDWRDVAWPRATLTGKTISQVTRDNTVVAFEALPGWHKKGRMNAVLIDGSALEMYQDSCLADLQLPVTGTSSSGP